ncbi:MAG: TonB-dependent receptor [Flavobacteriales bacterium]|nr:TonB-dependent receptor [Flavobacteriales bacterium]
MKHFTRNSFRVVGLILWMLCFASTALAQSGVIKGKITNLRNNETIPFATVIVQGSQNGVTTDIDGKYEITGLEPGLYNIDVSFIGFEKKTVFEIEVTNARAALIDVQLEETSVEIEAAEVVTSSFSNREEAPVSVRKIGVNEVKRNPGGNRDISRAIRALPGVASTPSFRNDIIIRGGAPNENRFYIDGIEIPNINHFATQGASGGPVGLINVDFIDDVEFYSGAFPAARGNALSSVLEFGFKEGRTDKFAANAVVGSSDLGITFEGPTGEKSSIIMSARRSYLQFLFQALGLPFLPTYNDFQVKWSSQIDSKNRITVLGLGAIDQFQLNTELGSDTTNEDFLENKYILDFLPVNTQWNYTTGVKWEHFGENGLTTVVGSRNMLNNRAFKHVDNNENLPLVSDYLSQEIENKFRVERKLYLDKGWKVNMGVNYEYAKYNTDTEQDVFSFEQDTLVSVDFFSEFDIHKYGAFAQVSKTSTDQRLVLSLGLRTDANEYSADMSNPLDQLSPRFSASYFLTPQLSANFNTGIYYQLPAYTVLGFRDNGVLANRENGLTYIRNKQVVAGLRYDVDSRNTTISVEGFYKDYDNYPQSIDRQLSLANLGADFGVIGNEAVESTSDGRAYGIEFLLQQKLYKGFYGIISYTYVRSEFTNGEGDFIPSSWDSRNLISLTGGKKFKKNWELGARFIYSGGTPFTPVDVEQSVQIPVWNATRFGLPDYSQLNALRIDDFSQLDVRIDKKWFYEKWSLNVFFDVQNVLGFVTPQPPTVDVERDENGNPIEDPNNPGSYIPRILDTSSGTALPTVGLIIEL